MQLVSKCWFESMTPGFYPYLRQVVWKFTHVWQCRRLTSQRIVCYFDSEEKNRQGNNLWWLNSFDFVLQFYVLYMNTTQFSKILELRLNSKSAATMREGVSILLENWSRSWLFHSCSQALKQAFGKNTAEFQYLLDILNYELIYCL